MTSPSNREEQRLVKALVKAHHNALDLFRRGAAAAREAGQYLHTLMELKSLKTREEVWRLVLESSDLTEETFSYRTCASYMKIAADWEWMEALLGDELFSMTQNGFLTEAARLNAKNRRRQEPATPSTDGEAATGGDADNSQAGSDDKGDAGQQGDTGAPAGGPSGDTGTGGRHVDPVIVLTGLCNSLSDIVQADDLTEEEKPKIEALIEKALQLISELRERCAKTAKKTRRAKK
jgi:hypothetical protein